MKRVDASLNGIERQSRRSMAGFGKALKMGALAAGGLAVGAGFLGKKMISLASDAGEVESKFNVIFGKEMPGMVRNLDAFSKATGASRFELRAQVADMGALLEPLSANKKAAGELSIEMTKLAVDLGSFNNVPTADALLAIRSGLVGEAEPLRRFGVLLNEAAVKAEGLRLGLVKGKEEMTEQQKVQARASLIMKQTTLAQGDAIRTSGSFANQIKRLKNGLTDMGTSIGVTLLPNMLRLVTWVNEHMPEIQATIEGVMRGVIAAIDFAVPIIQGLITTFQNIKNKVDAVWPDIAAKIGLATDSMNTDFRETTTSMRAFNTEHDNAWNKIVQKTGDSVGQLKRWYAGELKPAVQNVLTAITVAWDHFGNEITAIIKRNLNIAKTIISDHLGDYLAIFRIGLALLRGDWGKAWDELKGIFTRKWSEIKGLVSGEIAALKGMFSDAGSWLYGAGAAILQGLWDGLKSKWNAVAGWLGGLGDKIKSLKGPESKDKTLLTRIGELIMQSLETGMKTNWAKIESWLSGLSPKLSEKMGGAVDAAIAAIEARRGRFAEAFGGLVSAALAAFDDLHDGIKTAAEKALEAFDLKQIADENKKRLAELRKDLADASAALNKLVADGIAPLKQEEGESDEDFLARQLKAREDYNAQYEQLIADAATAQTTLNEEIERQRLEKQRKALETRAAASRKAEDDKTALERYHLDLRLTNLAKAYDNHEITERQMLRRLRKIFRDFDIPFAEAGKGLGLAVSAGLRDSINDVEKAAQDVVEAIARRLRKLRFVISVDVHYGSDGGSGQGPGKAAGGLVRKDRAYPVGEGGREWFVPWTQGRIVPENPRLPVGSGGGAKAMALEIVNRIYLDGRQIHESVQREEGRYQKRNGQSAFA